MIRELETLASDIRMEVVRMSQRGRASHLASSLSCVDLLVAATEALSIDPAVANDPSRDRLVLSKGHAVSALYATLAHRGFFARARLSEFNQPGSGLPEQPSPGCCPGVEVATGSLGHGLSLAAGFALAARIQGRPSAALAILSDGELNEGSVWETAMFASARELGRLTAVVDFNGWQATGRSRDVMQLDPLPDKWHAFGWDTVEVDGHDVGELLDAIEGERPAVARPRAIIAHTVKGRGVSFMEDDNNWHYRIPTVDEVDLACAELSRANEGAA